MKKDTPLVARILLVDDNELGSTGRKMILMDHGYGVETTLSGEEAWDILHKQHFDIVVTDFRMKGMTGLELIGRIREANLPTRVILLSGFVDGLGMTEKSTGADEVVCKSNKEIPELLRAVKKLLVRVRRRPPTSAAGAARLGQASAI